MGVIFATSRCSKGTICNCDWFTLSVSSDAMSRRARYLSDAFPAIRILFILGYGIKAIEVSSCWRRPLRLLDRVFFSKTFSKVLLKVVAFELVNCILSICQFDEVEPLSKVCISFSILSAMDCVPIAIKTFA